MDGGEATKRCSRCKQVKPLSAFNKLTRSKDGRQWNCRDCNAAWHAENRVHHNALIKARNKRIEQTNHQRIFEYKLERGCLDCGERDPTVLEFDHLRDKVMAVSVLIRYVNTWESLLAEIEKCDVVCSNCHTRRTAERGNDARWRLFLEHEERVRRIEEDQRISTIDSTIVFMTRRRLASLR
jgi:hypothetical protein